MIVHSQPIALPAVPNSHAAQDYVMADGGSYTGSSSGTFNPASFTRHFLGSPISWRTGSYGMSSRVPAGSPTAQFLNCVDVNEYRTGKTPSDNDSIMNALTVFDREGELCRNYTCCGLHLNDLHALLEHFEEVHIIVFDPSQPPSIQIPFNPKVHDTDPHTSLPLPTQQQLQDHIQNQFQLRQQQLQQHYLTPVDPDDMELDLELDSTAQHVLPSQQSSTRSSPSSCATTPPDTPISTPLSAYPSPRSSATQHLSHIHNLPFANYSPFISAPPSPPSTSYDPSPAASTRQNSPSLTSAPLPAGACRTNLNIALASGGFPRANSAAVTHLTNPEDAFNVYARFASDYSSTMPGAQFNAASCDEASALNLTSHQERQLRLQQQEQNSGCVPPALLFASTSSASASRVSNPAGQGSNTRSTSGPSGLTKAYSVPQVSPPVAAGIASPGPGTTSPPGPSALSATRPSASLLLSKPFKCPKPNCNKSYKQANGLKYHLTHGSCNFAPPKDLEHVKDLLERKRREKEQQHQQDGQQGANLTRSTSLGSAPTPSTAPIPVAGTSSAHAQTQPPTPSSETIGAAPISPTSILGLTYNELSNISESDLREVEREAERRLRPFACGVGDCQRRYKNMNGLRYHYQHSGDHGAIGLALLASGQHECLGVGKRHSATRSSLLHSNSLYGSTQSVRGSVSVPVSRAGSVPNSRVGTPQPQPTSTILPQNHFGNVSAPGNSTPNSTVHTPTGSSHASPLTSPCGSPGEADEKPCHPMQQHQQQPSFSPQQLAAYQYVQLHRQYQAQLQAVMQQRTQQSRARYPYPGGLPYAYLNANKEVHTPQQQRTETPSLEVASFPGST